MSGLTLKEKLGIKDPVPTNARQAYGMDIYQARNLCAKFEISTFEEIWHGHRRATDPEGFYENVRQAVVGSKKKSEILVTLLKSIVTPPIFYRTRGPRGVPGPPESQANEPGHFGVSLRPDGGQLLT